MSGTMVIFIELPDLHWHFDPVLNASVMVARAAMRVYIIRAPVMSPFFHPHYPFDDITLDDICPYFLLLRYPTDGESDSDTCLTPIVSLDSDSSEPSYSSYHVESDLFEPSLSLVIRLTSDLSSSSVASRHVPPPVHGRGFIRTRAVPRGCGRARGGGHGDVAPSGFGNGFLPPDK